MKRVLWVLAAFTFLGLLLFAMLRGFGKNPREVPFKLMGQTAPAFSLPSLGGETFSLEGFRGRPLVINFWSSWCVPCAEEAMVLEASFKKWGHKVAFLGVVFEDSEANAKGFLRKYPSSYPQLFSPVSTVAIDYAVTGVPETYFLNEEGKIIGRYAAPILSPAQFDLLLLDARLQEALLQHPQLQNTWLKTLLLRPSEFESPWLKEVLSQSPQLREFWLLNVLHQNPTLKEALLKDAEITQALAQSPSLQFLFNPGAPP